MTISRIIYTLRPEVPPYIDIIKIKSIIEKDGYLDERMRKLLIIMKKSRASYLTLGKEREILINEEEGYYIERSLNPLTGYSFVWITKDNLKNLKTNKEQYYQDLNQSFDNLGYNIKEITSNFDKKKFEEIIKLIKMPERQEYEQ